MAGLDRYGWPDAIGIGGRITPECALDNPPGDGRKPDWFEALCSLHYLMKSSRRTFDDAKQEMGRLKPHLNDVVDDARERLENFQLI